MIKHFKKYTIVTEVTDTGNTDETETYDLTNYEESKQYASTHGYLPMIPEEHRTEEVCSLCFLNGTCLKFKSIPEKFITQDMINALIDNGHSNLFRRFENIPEKFRNEETYSHLLDNSWKYLSILPIEERSYELCKKAAKRSKQALEFIPKEHQTAELTFIAATTSSYVEDKYQSIFFE
jgi:hypothetical protein